MLIDTVVSAPPVNQPFSEVRSYGRSDVEDDNGVTVRDLSPWRVRCTVPARTRTGKNIKILGDLRRVYTALANVRPCMTCTALRLAREQSCGSARN